MQGLVQLKNYWLHKDSPALRWGRERGRRERECE